MGARQCGSILFTWIKYTLCLKKTCDYIFDDNFELELSIYNNFWHTYYQEYRPLTDVFIIPSYLFHTLENCRDVNISKN